METLKGKSTNLVFFVNGRKITDAEARPEMTLLTYLRKKLGLCGTKLGCGEGGCGACTVMVSFVDQHQSGGAVRHISVNACLAPVVAMHGMAVTTVEGIGSTSSKLHAVQEKIANSYGSQCGFCTPGIVMSMYTLLRNKPNPGMKDIMTYFQGNLCRCTGYRPILEGFKSFTEESWARNSVSSSGEGCSGMVDGKCCKTLDQNGYAEIEEGETNGCNGYLPEHESQEPIFPPELKLNAWKFTQSLLKFESDRMIWFRPSNLDQMLQLKTEFPDAKIVIGNTELGVEMKFKNCHYPTMIQPSQVEEMNAITVTSKGIKFGSAVTLSRLEKACLDEIQKRPEYQTRVLTQIVEMLEWFAGMQIRNVAAIGGNIMTGSPISDLNPIFMASNCQLEVQRFGEAPRIINMDDKFYIGYRRNILAKQDVLISILIPLTSPKEFFVAYKQARRRDDDIAIVNSAFWFDIDDEHTINMARIAYGGMAPTTVMPLKTMEGMKNKAWSPETIESACDSILNELKLPPNVPGSMVRYRRSLTISFLFKAFLSVNNKYGLLPVEEDCISATEGFHKNNIKSSQDFEIKDSGGHTQAVGKSVIHKSAVKQACGQAVYVDDMPSYENELYMGLVLSNVGHAEILSIDAGEARSITGVEDFICVEDLRKRKFRTRFRITVEEDEVVFADKVVTSIGQVVGAVLAQDQATAQLAAKRVKVSYKKLPTIITMEEAIEAKSFFKMPFDSIKRGDPIKAFESCHQVLEGEMRTGGQEHFYFETQACIAVPSKEDGEMLILSSTQNPTETQHRVSEVLDVSMNKINCRVKRMGGGFGGKETRSVPLSVLTAVAAAIHNRPVRIMLDRNEDMISTGHRHPFLGKYKIGFDSNGIIKALDLDLYNNGGCTMDLSCAVMERGLFHCENAYNIENIHCRATVCKTNLPSNTAFRGFGAPQGMMVIESAMDEVAHYLGRDPAEIRFQNLYREGHRTHFSQMLTNCTLERCWKECVKQADVEREKRAIEAFNKNNRWKKMGMSIIPVKFGIAFTYPVLNQAGALIQVFKDGSVLLTHAGTEMGQGLHTKMIQIAGQTLGIDQDNIHISDTATDKVPNTSATAASASSDLNGMAILNACQTILERLKPLREPQQTWKDLIMKAYCNKISLSATGFYATEDVYYDHETNTGNPFNYFTFGACCSVVQIDCLTGDHDVVKTNIVMDLGQSLNPGIDIGQIEGAYMQGYGLFIMEQLIHTPDGVLLTQGPGAYKIPGFGDVPSEFNVSLLKSSSNPKAVFSSKAVGEPPLFLASSVFFAIKAAIRSARRDHANDSKLMTGFFFEAPATAERIRMACEDTLTEKVEQLPDPGTFKPWGIQV